METAHYTCFAIRQQAVSELAKQVHGITDKMLSKELRDLEMNELVKRTVYDTVPVIVEYSMTPYGETLEKLIEEPSSLGNPA
jgi:DNA-binding HxlR family transcriptional regulator